jgi:hypothetical protein
MHIAVTYYYGRNKKVEILCPRPSSPDRDSRWLRHVLWNQDDTATSVYPESTREQDNQDTLLLLCSIFLMYTEIKKTK